MKIVETVQAHCAWLEQLRRRGLIGKTDELRMKMDAWEQAARYQAKYFGLPDAAAVDFDIDGSLVLAKDFLRLRTLLDPGAGKQPEVVDVVEHDTNGEARDASAVQEASAGQ